jgi:curved DNA-binding protein CbpA
MNQPKEQKLQFIRIDRGISQFNHDYYAALGLPITSSPFYIRHVYVSIARILHPDVYGFSDEEKEIATQYLAKLVNPAYNVLMKEEERRAYQGIFKLLAKRLMQKSRNVQIHSKIACELMMAPNDGLYERSVATIANMQYQSIKTILEYTAQISELNLVYILYKEGYQYGSNNMPPVLMPMAPTKSPQVYSANYPTPPQKTSYASPPPQYSIYQPPSNRKPDSDETIIQTRIEERDTNAVGDRLKICEIYISQSDWKSALKDLREILQLDRNNSKCHAMLGVVYKNINQPQMAKVSFQRSLQINPKEPLALKHINDLSKDLSKPIPSQINSNTTKNNSKSEPKPNPATTKKAPLPPPQKRGWLSNLLGWASKDIE